MSDYPPNPRRLRRGDVVHERFNGGTFMYGRVWRRVDDNHVVVIDSGKHVQLYHEDELILTDYIGRWKWQRHPGNDYGHTPRWSKMTSLRRLKAMAKDYNASFGGISGHGHRWTKAERQDALANPKRWQPR